MQNLRRFLTPGWVMGVLAVILFAWACFAVLAPWQLGKSDDLDARNARLAESVEAAPAPLGEVVTDPADFAEREWRLVTLDGEWVPDAEALLRLRSVDGEPVYQVLTVFSADDGREFLVNRGHIPVGENNTVPEYEAAPAGEVEITARLRAAESGQAEPVTVDGLPAVRIIDPVVLGETLGQPVDTDGYLQLTGEQPGSLTPAPIPSIEAGPYLSYGLQWLAFGILAPVALGYFAFAEFRARRRDAQEAAELQVSAPGTAGGGDGDETTNRDDDDNAASTDGPGIGAATVSGSIPAGDDAAGGRGAAATTSTSPGPADDVIAARERAMRDRYGTRDDAEKRRALRRADRLRS
ncbi:SURF1 family cytochrome oxidase biogenesis protein [Dietzia aerolata]|uniref:SURF1-like protein n=1 Tax=Dietzia aerolata TaxID=595984 RepID=A0ABV5JLS1_9ACTN